MISEEIIKRFEQCESVKSIAHNVGCSWNRVVKILSTNGCVINDTHAQILDLFNRGMSADEISLQMDLNLKTVKAYLPGTRGCVYKENLSANAERIRKSRSKKGGYSIKKEP